MSDNDQPPPIKIDFAANGPNAARAHGIARALALDLVRTDDAEEKKVVVGEMLAEVLDHSDLMAQVIVYLAEALVRAAQFASADRGDDTEAKYPTVPPALNFGDAERLLASVFEVAKPSED